MENEMEKDTALTFGVGLNKTEYVIFQETMKKFSAGKRFSGVLTTAITIFSVFAVRNALKADAATLSNPYLLSLLLFLVLLFLGVTVLPPIVYKRRAAKAYEKALAGGQVFDGMVTVNSEGVTKVTESGTVTLPFDRDLLCIERQEMLIFVNRLGQAIVLPARCLTAEDATDVRLIAQRSINPRFYVIKGRLQPTATARMALSPVDPPAVLYTFTVQYEEKERQALIKTAIRRDIFRSAPLYFLFCFLLSVSAGLDNGFLIAAIIFWIAVALFAGLKALYWVPRYKSTAAADGVFTITLNDRALVMENKADPVPRKVILPWREIAHAVESEDTIEIYNNRQFVYIPKRCVGDIEFLRSIVNDKMKGNQ